VFAAKQERKGREMAIKRTNKMDGKAILEKEEKE
jgi:hypothetical protein